MANVKNKGQKCASDGCEREAKVKGLCHFCYTRWWREQPRGQEWLRKYTERAKGQRLTEHRRKNSRNWDRNLENEVAGHLKRGRNLADIVIFTDCPVSLIKPIMEKLALAQGGRSVAESAQSR